MTSKEFKRIASLLKEVYSEIKKEALESGISILSPEFDIILSKAREKVLETAGFTLEQYREAKARVEGFTQADMLGEFEIVQQKIKEISEIHIPSQGEIKMLAEEVAREIAPEYITPPQITNQIVREVTIEKPQIIETTREIVRRERYDDKPIKKELGRILQQLDEIKIPEQKTVEELREILKSDFSVFFEHNINTLDMPNWRKLGMGLQGQIDDLRTLVAQGGGGGSSSIGGTITGATQGSVLFAGASGVLAQDNANLFFDDTNNRLGIGTTAPEAKFQVNMPNAFAGTSIVGSTVTLAGNNASIITTNAQAANVGGMLTLGGMRDDGAVSPGVFGGIKGGKLNSTTGDTNGYLGFYTLTAGIAFAERMRIDNLGNVGIGTTGPTNKVDIVAGTLLTTAKALSVTATLANSAVTENGVLYTITGAGSGSNLLNALNITFSAGYTGSGPTNALSFGNSSAGTGSDYFSSSSNTGVSGITNGSTATGHNIGGWFNARNGLNNVGVFGRAIVATNAALNIGVFGAALNGTNTVGGYFGLHSGNPNIAVSAALIADNGGIVAPIFVARDNGTVAFTIADGGNVITTAPVRLKGYTVATLPAGTQGDTAFVTDALAPAFLVAVAGGGAVITTVFYNGTNWVAQ